MKTQRARLLAWPVALTTGVILLTACGGSGDDDDPRPQDTTASETAEETYEPPEPTRSGVLDYDTSQTLMEGIFDALPYSQQRDVCTGVNLFGHDWAVTALQGDLSPQQAQGTNWEAAADYLEVRCAEDFQ